MWGKKMRTSQSKWPRGRLAGLGALLLTLLALGAGCSSLNFSSLKFWGTAKSHSDLEVRPATGDTARLLHNAHYLSLMGRQDLALKELEEAYQREPHNPKVANALALGYEAVGEWERAQQVYREALARGGDNPALQNNLCYSYYRAGDFKRAEDCFRQALERDPRNMAARNNLGLLLCRTGRREEARCLWQEAEGAVVAEKKIKEVLAFMGTEGSATYARQSPPAVAPAATIAGSGSTAAGKARPTAAKPEAKAAPTVASAPREVRHQTVKPSETSGPARERAKSASPPAPKVASVKPGTAAALPSRKQRPAKAVSAPSGRVSLKATVTKAPPQIQLTPLTLQEFLETSIRVENGNGFPHLARDTRSFLWGEGFNVVAIKNYIDFGVEETVIYCRPEAAKVAKLLGEKFFHTANVQVSEKLTKGVDVRVIMGHDLLLKEDLLAKLAG